MIPGRALLLAGACVIGLLGPSTAPSGTAEGAKRRNIVDTEKPLYSQGMEEVIIRDHFQDMRDGFFVDVGAAHYKELSTTYYLEKHLGWSGIGIDALDEYGPEYETHRPNTEFVHAAVTDKSGETISFFRSDSWRELSSLDKEVAEEHGERWRNDGRTTEVIVATVTLDDLLDDRGIETIDFLSMDIELSEPPALRGFDIQRFKPKLVCIEAMEEIRSELMEYFTRNGYRRIERYSHWDDLNWYFEPAGAPDPKSEKPGEKP